jgi:hypothetical protein
MMLLQCLDTQKKGFFDDDVIALNGSNGQSAKDTCNCGSKQQKLLQRPPHHYIGAVVRGSL